MSKVIVIDAGHGYNTAGKRCLKSIDKNQTREWFLNDRIADMVENNLKDYECKVLRSDDTTGKKDISLSTRVKTANNAKADIFVSIHHNAGINGRSGGGTVVYHYKNSVDRGRAQRLYDSVVGKTGLVGNRANKVSVGDYYVINQTNMPALLLENGFMDSTKDTPIILTQGFAEMSAKGIVEFLVSELNLKKKEKETPTPTPSIPNAEYYPACAKKYTTIYTGLTSIGVNGSFAFRKKIAKANNITGYVGTATQNTQMLNLLKAGLLKKA